MSHKYTHEELLAIRNERPLNDEEYAAFFKYEVVRPILGCLTLVVMGTLFGAVAYFLGDVFSLFYILTGACYFLAVLLPFSTPISTLRTNPPSGIYRFPGGELRYGPLHNQPTPPSAGE